MKPIYTRSMSPCFSPYCVKSSVHTDVYRLLLYGHIILQLIKPVDGLGFEVGEDDKYICYYLIYSVM